MRQVGFLEVALIGCPCPGKGCLTLGELADQIVGGSLSELPSATGVVTDLVISEWCWNILVRDIWNNLVLVEKVAQFRCQWCGVRKAHNLLECEPVLRRVMR